MALSWRSLSIPPDREWLLTLVLNVSPLEGMRGRRSLSHEDFGWPGPEVGILGQKPTAAPLLGSCSETSMAGCPVAQVYDFFSVFWWR